MPVRKGKKKYGAGKKNKKGKKVKIPFPSETQKRMSNQVHHDGRRKILTADLADVLKNLKI
jgi:hypothetical protein